MCDKVVCEKMVCDKVWVERWRVTMLCGGGGGGGGGGAGYRIINKNPTQRFGEMTIKNHHEPAKKIWNLDEGISRSVNQDGDARSHLRRSLKDPIFRTHI